MLVRMMLTAGLVCVGLIAASPLARGQDLVAEAENAARTAAESSPGKKYAEDVGRRFGKDHGAAFSRCARETPRPNLANFEFFLRMDAVGVVEEVRSKPSTNMAVCVASRLKGWKASPPPAPGQWVKVSVTLRPK